MTSFSKRNNSLFLRNKFKTDGKWAIPLIQSQELNTDNLKLIACSETKANDSEAKRTCGVHFFVDDFRFTSTYSHPQRSLKKYFQYAFLLSPDFSLYAEMPLWKQIEHVAKNRWVGAYWQEQGKVVIPTISWSTPQSFEFCFCGVEKNSTVTIGMIGCKKARNSFMRGYNEMLSRLEPKKIIVYGNPFPEMNGPIIAVDYLPSKKAVS